MKKKDIKILENPNWTGWRAMADTLPSQWRYFIKEHSFFFPLELLKWIIIDKTRPRFFHPYGFTFYTGLPGTGKTMFMTHQLELYRKKYGNEILIGTNYNYKNQDFQVNNYQDIIKIYNKPTIIGYDEIQNDFDSRKWEKLDTAFSERITQSRKLQGLKILATAQRFGFVDKRLRELTDNVFECRTFFNRLTMAKIYEPQIKEKIEDGSYMDFNSVKTTGIKMFVQTDNERALYSSYDILLKVQERLREYQKTEKAQLQQIREFLTETTATT